MIYYNININSNVSKSSAVEDLQVVNYMKRMIILSIPCMPISHKPLYLSLFLTISNMHLEFWFSKLMYRNFNERVTCCGQLHKMLRLVLQVSHLIFVLKIAHNFF